MLYFYKVTGKLEIGRMSRKLKTDGEKEFFEISEKLIFFTLIYIHHTYMWFWNTNLIIKCKQYSNNIYIATLNYSFNGIFNDFQIKRKYIKNLKILLKIRENNEILFENQGKNGILK